MTLVGADDTFSDELFLVLLRGRGHALDLLVHDWLREARLVDLVVSIVTITDHVKHDIFAVLAPVLDRKPARFNHGDGVRGVYP